MHCDILQAARLDKARAELGSSRQEQHILKAINGGDLEAKDGVRDEWWWGHVIYENMRLLVVVRMWVRSGVG